MTGERRQTWLLARTFFGRLFESDLMPAGLPQVQLVVSVFAFFAAPSLVLPLFLLKKYVAAPPAVIQPGMAWDRTMALLLAMTATAFITLVIWENVFPDRRDSRILGVLPVRPRAMVAGRLAALVMLFALLFLTTAAISSFGFGILAAMTNQPAGFLTVVLAHFLTVAAAQGAVFFGILFVQCALLVVTGARTAHRAAVAFQVLLIVAVMQMPLLLPAGARFSLDAAGIPGWLPTASAFLPPLWFLSLFQTLVGAPYAGTGRLAGLAAGLGIALPVLALLTYAASYRRLMRLAIEGRPAPRIRLPWSGWMAVDRLSSALSRSREGAGVCAFTLRTLARNRQHRLVLAVWIGVAVALTVSAALPLIVRFGWARLAEPSQATLVGPLIFAALVQTGMRSLFAIPVEIRAGWVFRLHEPRDTTGTLEGAAAALMVCGVAGPAVLALATGWLLWGIGHGLAHAVYVAALAALLAQFLVTGFDRVPFTVPYVPGAARIGRLWPLYLTVFTTFTYTMAALEAYVLGRTASFIRTVTVLAVLAAVLFVVRRRASRRLPSLRFEPDDDGPTVVSLQADRTTGLS